MFHARTSDFQDVVAQGVLTYRASDLQALVKRVDFALDLTRGAWALQPLEKLALMLSQMAQEHALDYMSVHPIKKLLTDGGLPVRDAIYAGVRANAGLAEMGVIRPPSWHTNRYAKLVPRMYTFISSARLVSPYRSLLYGSGRGGAPTGLPPTTPKN